MYCPLHFSIVTGMENYLGAAIIFFLLGIGIVVLLEQAGKGSQSMRHFGLIGYPLGHSFSKKYFTEKFKELGFSRP